MHMAIKQRLRQRSNKLLVLLGVHHYYFSNLFQTTRSKRTELDRNGLWEDDI
jgi:hypothetical protein